MTRSVLNVGVAGLGVIGKVHVDNLARLAPAARIRRVVDVRERVARAVGDELGVQWSTSYDSLLDDRHVDAVLIATPPSTHPEMVIRAAESGKHVFCEKPLAHELPAATEAVDRARRAGIRLYVGFNRRFDPDYAALKERVDRGELGPIHLFLTSHRDMNPPPEEVLRRGDDLLLYDMACHDLDAARWLVGEVDEISAFGSSRNGSRVEPARIDSLVLVLRFTCGALGSIDNTHVAGYGFECCSELVGSEGTLRVVTPLPSNVVALRRGRIVLDHGSHYLDRFRQAYAREMAAFVKAVRDGTSVLASGEDGLASLALATAAELSYRDGKTVRMQHARDGEVARYRIPQVV
jgi:myo-inositol 2-dehydrogenase/D-chiro-inositol 1-dehydrogenase